MYSSASIKAQGCVMRHIVLAIVIACFGSLQFAIAQERAKQEGGWPQKIVSSIETDLKEFMKDAPVTLPEDVVRANQEAKKLIARLEEIEIYIRKARRVVERIVAEHGSMARCQRVQVARNLSKEIEKKLAQTVKEISEELDPEEKEILRGRVGVLQSQKASLAQAATQSGHDCPR